MDKKKYFLVLNYIAFQVCWFALLFFENWGLIVFFIFLNIHFALIYYIDDIKYVKLEFATISIVSIIGLCIDIILANYGVFQFEYKTIMFLPWWYIAFWPLLASTLNHCFYLFHRFNILLLGIIGAASVPVIYSGAEKASAVFSLGEPKLLSLLAIGACWFFLLPFAIKMTLILRHLFIGTVRDDEKLEKY